jgi:hypothetical protein
MRIDWIPDTFFERDKCFSYINKKIFIDLKHPSNFYLRYEKYLINY